MSPRDTDILVAPGASEGFSAPDANALPVGFLRAPIGFHRIWQRGGRKILGAPPHGVISHVSTGGWRESAIRHHHSLFVTGAGAGPRPSSEVHLQCSPHIPLSPAVPAHRFLIPSRVKFGPRLLATPYQVMSSVPEAFVSKVDARTPSINDPFSKEQSRMNAHHRGAGCRGNTDFPRFGPTKARASKLPFCLQNQ